MGGWGGGCGVSQKGEKKWGCTRGVRIQMHHSCVLQRCAGGGPRMLLKPKDLSSSCCWLWQPAVRGAQGERRGQVKG